MTQETQTPETVLCNYFRAKDENRPDLMRNVFCEDATLKTCVKAASIVFPEVSQGCTAITDVLIRQFRQSYENVRSFYLDRPAAVTAEFSCRWLVGMSERASGNVRVGCGRYDWTFQPAPPRLATNLLITIEGMQVLPPANLAAVRAWLRQLDYPWSSARAVVAAAPAIKLLDPVMHYLRGNEAEPGRR
jgi:hypothetical protein